LEEERLMNPSLDTLDPTPPYNVKITQHFCQ